MCLTSGVKRSPPNIRPQGTALDDLIRDVMPPVISLLTHIDPRAQVSRSREVSPQEGQLRSVAALLGRWGHDPTTDTASTLAGTQVHDVARFMVGHGQEHHRIHAVSGRRNTSCTEVLGSRLQGEIYRGSLLESTDLRRSTLTREPEGNEPIHPPAIAQTTS